MIHLLKSILRKSLFYLALIAVAPLVPLLTVARKGFFALDSALDPMRHIIAELRDMPPPISGPARVLPFWVAWFMAFLLLAVAMGMGVIVVAQSEDWNLTHQLPFRAITVVLAGAAVYFAFRFALAGTRSLQRAMAHNLAMLIGFELDELRLQAERRALILAGHMVPQEAEDGSNELRVPQFFGEREEIRRLLGEPTERALEDLLQSLLAFNSSLTPERSEDGPSPSPLHADQPQAQLRIVDECLERAARAVSIAFHSPA